MSIVSWVGIIGPINTGKERSVVQGDEPALCSRVTPESGITAASFAVCFNCKRTGYDDEFSELDEAANESQCWVRYRNCLMAMKVQDCDAVGCVRGPHTGERGCGDYQRRFALSRQDACAPANDWANPYRHLALERNTHQDFEQALRAKRSETGPRIHWSPTNWFENMQTWPTSRGKRIMKAGSQTCSAPSFEPFLSLRGMQRLCVPDAKLGIDKSERG